MPQAHPARAFGLIPKPTYCFHGCFGWHTNLHRRVLLDESHALSTLSHRPVAARPRHWCRAARTLRLGPDVHSAEEDEAAVEERTLAWVRNVVVRLNLCPFAEPALRPGRLRLVVTEAADEAGMWGLLLSEAELLAASGADEVLTTLLVAPRFAAGDFRRFHRFARAAEDFLEESDRLADKVMVACFHPRNQWADAASPTAPLNYDRRAPYSIVNLLRAGMVDEAVEQGRTNGILERNRATLERIGEEKLERLYETLEWDEKCGRGER